MLLANVGPRNVVVSCILMSTTMFFIFGCLRCIYGTFLFQVSDYAARNDAILLVVIPASHSPEISSSRALRLAKEYDAEGFYCLLSRFIF